MTMPVVTAGVRPPSAAPLPGCGDGLVPLHGGDLPAVSDACPGAPSPGAIGGRVG